MNLLYAAGEIERLAYETLNANASTLDDEDESNSYAVKATATHGAYRMTYIPLLWLSGLLGVFLAALIPFGLLLHGRRTNSVGNWREVNTVQLMADTVTGLRDEHIVEQIRTAGPSGSSKLARATMVKYEILSGEDVSLKLVDGPIKEHQRLDSGGDTEIDSGQ